MKITQIKLDHIIFSFTIISLNF